MPCHRVISVVRDVVDWDATRSFYREFGLTETAPGTFATERGGEQLELREAAWPTVVRIDIGVDTELDLDEIGARLTALHIDVQRSPGSLEATEPVSRLRIRLLPDPRLERDVPPEQGELRRDELVPRGSVRPQRLGHVVLGCTDVEGAKRFFLDGLGMRLSDYVNAGAFMRFETDHHNIVLTPAPFTLLHHTAWKVRSVDEIGYGGTQMTQNHPHRHAWGLGRHAASANYFWYLRDPAGAFAEYYHSEMDERAPDGFFWDMVPGMDGLPVAAWASPAFEEAPLTPPGITAPEEMPAPILEHIASAR